MRLDTLDILVLSLTVFKRFILCRCFYFVKKILTFILDRLCIRKMYSFLKVLNSPSN